MRLDYLPTDQVLLNDPLEHRRITCSIPSPFRIHDPHWPTLTDPETVGLSAQHTPLLGQPELTQTPLQIHPSDKPALPGTALRLGLVTAQEDVPPRDRHPDRGRNTLLASD